MTDKQIYLILAYASMYSALVPLGIGIVRYRHLSPPLRWIQGNIALGLLLSTASVWLTRLLENNHFLSYLNTAIDVLCVSLFFANVIRHSLIRILALWLGPAFWLFIVLDALVLTDLYHLNSRSSTLETVLVLALALWYMRELMGQLPTQYSLVRFAPFWVTVGLLVINIASLLFNAFSNQLLDTSENLYLQAVNWAYLASLLGNSLFAFAFAHARRIKKPHRVCTAWDAAQK